VYNWEIEVGDNKTEEVELVWDWSYSLNDISQYLCKYAEIKGLNMIYLLIKCTYSHSIYNNYLISFINLV
jgi:hypothetical protein